LFKAVEISALKSKRENSNCCRRRNITRPNVDTLRLDETEVLKAGVDQQHLSRNTELHVAGRRRRAHDEAGEIGFVVEDKLWI
jgi:hypothetical protein